MSDIHTIPVPDDAEILLDGEQVCGFIVRPWTISKCAAMTPVFEMIAGELKKRNLKFRDLFDISKGKVELLNMEPLFFTVMPYSPDIIAITLDLSADELKKISQDKMFDIMSAIVRQNVGYVKNLFALMMQTVATLVPKTTGAGT